jgi:cytoskeleton protein RodZ
MADNADDSAKQSDAEPRAGQRLANARRANGISMRDIAKELHLDEVKVQALEDNRFDVLGAPVFTKGYLRKYAELVHVPIDDVLADYYRMNRAAGAPPVVGPRRPKESNPINPGPWIAVIVVLALAAGLAWWWFNRSPTPANPVTRDASNIPQTPQREPVDEAPAESTGAQSGEAAPAGNEDSVEAPSAADAGAPASTAEEQPSAPPPITSTGSSTTQLLLRFSGDCWTEVTDGNGNRLFFGLGTDGRNVTVSGVPPIRVLLGDNDNVRLQVNGVDYVVKPSELRGNTARLSIGGP